MKLKFVNLFNLTIINIAIVQKLINDIYLILSLQINLFLLNSIKYFIHIKIHIMFY